MRLIYNGAAYSVCSLSPFGERDGVSGSRAADPISRDRNPCTPPLSLRERETVLAACADCIVLERKHDAGNQARGPAQGGRAPPARPRQFVSDMMLPGQSEVAFLRSPIAHGRIGASSSRRAPRRGVPARRPGGVRRSSPTPQCRATSCPRSHPLATARCGSSVKPVAMCVAPTRARRPRTWPSRSSSNRRAARAGRRACGAHAADHVACTRTGATTSS